MYYRIIPFRHKNTLFNFQTTDRFTPQALQDNKL